MSRQMFLDSSYAFNSAALLAFGQELRASICMNFHCRIFSSTAGRFFHATSRIARVGGKGCASAVDGDRTDAKRRWPKEMSPLRYNFKVYAVWLAVPSCAPGTGMSPLRCNFTNLRGSAVGRKFHFMWFTRACSGMLASILRVVRFLSDGLPYKPSTWWGRATVPERDGRGSRRRVPSAGSRKFRPHPIHPNRE